MKMARKTIAPTTPQNSTRCWCFAGTAKYAEDHREHEHVVDREGLLDQVAGEVLAAGLGPLPGNTRPPNPRPSATQTADQIGGLAQGHLVGVAVEDEQVEHEHHGDDDAQDDPDGEIGRHGRLPTVVWLAVGLPRPRSGGTGLPASIGGRRVDRSTVMTPSACWGTPLRCAGVYPDWPIRVNLFM